VPRSMVGLLAAVGTAMSALVAFAHGYLICLAILVAAAAAGLAAYLALFSGKEAALLPGEVSALPSAQDEIKMT
jgi:hypothetical protein